MHLRPTPPTASETQTDVPWIGFEKYPQGLPDLSAGDDVEEYDRKLFEDAGPRLCTDINQPDNMSIGVLTFSSSSNSVAKSDITTPAEFESCFKSVDFNSRYVILKPAKPRVVSRCRLKIPEEFLRKLLMTYNVFPAFLPYLHAFGTKITDVDQHFGGASYKLHFPTPNAIDAGVGKIGYELCYNFKWVAQKENIQPPSDDFIVPPFETWRIRQTGVYQRHKPSSTANSSASAQDFWILTQPATRVCGRIDQNSTETNNNPLSAHLLFLAAAAANWREYFNVLESYFLERWESAVYKQVSMEGPTGNSTSLGDQRRLHGGKDPAYSFEVSFHDVQKLQQLEEEVQTFLAALGINRDVLTTLKTLNRTLGSTSNTTSPATIIFNAALEQYLTDLNRHTRNVDALLRKIRGRSRLLYNVLDYQNSVALSAQGVLRAQFEGLQGLERHKTNLWTKKTVRDAVGVKIMTTMALLYLPASFIASFLDAGIITVGEGGNGLIVDFHRLEVSKELLLVFAMAAAALTALTFAAWWEFDRRAGKQVEKIDGHDEEDDPAAGLGPGNSTTMQTTPSIPLSMLSRGALQNVRTNTTT